MHNLQTSYWMLAFPETWRNRYTEWSKMPTKLHENVWTVWNGQNYNMNLYNMIVTLKELKIPIEYKDWLMIKLKVT